jgi:hypothetical protein
VAEVEGLDPAEFDIVVAGLDDESVGVRVASFEALSRLPLTAPDWRAVGRYALRVLANDSWTDEGLAVIGASPSIPLSSVRNRIAELVDSADPVLRARATEAVRDIGHPRAVPTLLTLPAGDPTLFRIASVDISGAVADVRAEFRARAVGSEDAFWLALALALAGEDAELRAVVEFLAQSPLMDWCGRVNARLRWVMAARRLPASTVRWLTEAAQPALPDLVRALTDPPHLTASFSDRAGTALQPGWNDGPNPGFSARGDLAPEEAREADELLSWIGAGYSPERSNEVTEALAAAWVEAQPVHVSRLIERASEVSHEGYYFKSNKIVNLVQLVQGYFRPDVAGLFETYRDVMTRSWESYRVGVDEASIAFARADDEGGPRSFCLQIGWIVSRGGLPGLVSALATHLRAAETADRIAAAYMIADAAAYVTEAIAPQFGGGSGPPREVARELVDESDDETVAATSAPGAGPALEQAIRRTWAELVTNGRVAFNAPDVMRQGRLERVDVAVGRHEGLDATLLEMLRGPGKPRIETIETSPFMSVELKGRGFEVTPVQATGTEQLVHSTALWEFDVLPVLSGSQTLQLCVAMRIPIQDQPVDRVSIPVLERQIQVAVAPLYISRQVLKGNWKWFIISLLGSASAIAAWLKLIRGGD